MDRDTYHTGLSRSLPQSPPNRLPASPSGDRRFREAVDGRDRGFTLVELLVVVIIVGILAAIAIPAYLNQRKKSVDASLKADLKNAATTAQTLVADPMRLMHEDGWLPQGSRVVTYDLFRRAGFKASPGNVVRVSGDPSEGWYQLCAYNPGASTATGQGTALFYDSRGGGMQATTVSCPSGWGGAPVNTSWYGVSYSEYGSPATDADWLPSPPWW